MKVLIADDEHLIRYGLHSMIDELGLDLTVVGEAATGDDLVAAALKLRPDICFVDIRMPGLGGLAAIRKARKAGSRARWIVLTSHAEFDYAAEAIQLGVTSYLLKPAGPDQLKALLIPLMNEIGIERRGVSARFESSLLAALAASKTGSTGVEPPQVSAGWLLAVRVDAGAQAPKAAAAAFVPDFLDKFRTSAALKSQSLVTAGWQDAPDVLMFAASWDPDIPESRIEASLLLERMGMFIKQTANTDLRATGFCAAGLTTWDELQRALPDLKNAFSRRLVLGVGSVHGLDVSARRMESLPPQLTMVCQRIEEYLSARERGDIPGLEARALAIRDAFAAVPGGASALDAASRHLAFRVGIEPPAEEQSSLKALLAWAEELAAGTRSELSEVRRSADLQLRVVEKVDHYLRQRLSADVRVPDIASSLGLTPNYLSSLYHKFTQSTISERLTTLRLDQARELLSRPGNQVKEVAAAVGYKSPRHFARLYLERFGTYPSGR